MGKSQRSEEAAPCDTNWHSVAPLGQLSKEFAPALRSSKPVAEERSALYPIAVWDKPPINFGVRHSAPDYMSPTKFEETN